MSWSDYPYEDPKLNTYMKPVIYELYYAIHERYRIAKRIHWNDWIPKPTQGQVEDVFNSSYGGGGSSVRGAINTIWRILEDCLEVYRDPFYVKLDHDPNNLENYYIYQTWMGMRRANILGYQTVVGYHRNPIQFINHYEQVIGEDLQYLREFFRLFYRYPENEDEPQGKTLTLAGIFRDFYMVIKNCLNNVVSQCAGSTIWVEDGYDTNDSIRSPSGSVGFDIRKWSDDNNSPTTASEAWESAYGRLIVNDLVGDTRSEQGMFNYGYNNYYGSMHVNSIGSASNRTGPFPLPWSARATVQQRMVKYGYKMVDYKGDFYNYSDYVLKSIHTIDTANQDLYSNLNRSYIGDLHKVHECPTIIENGNVIVDYQELDGSDAYDFNIDSNQTLNAGAVQLTLGSYVNINEEDALEYYIGGSN